MKCLKNSIEIDNLEIDYDKRTPYTFVTYEKHEGMEYRIVHTVRKGPADSRIIDYEFEKIGEKADG